MKFRNTGGIFRLREGKKTRMIKHNQIFEANPEQIPKAFRDIIVPVEESKRTKIAKKKITKEETSVEMDEKAKESKQIK